MTEATSPTKTSPAETSPAETSLTKTMFRAEGFSCPSCVNKIEQRLQRLPGVEGVKVRFTSSRVEVDHHPDVVSVDDLVVAIGKAGYKARPATL